METTERLGLNLLIAGQTQKEIWLNESLLLVDLLLSGRMESIVSSAPPADPEGAVFYRIGPGATGEWLGQDGKIAAMTAGGWRFVTPFDGLTLRDVNDRTSWAFAEGTWTKGVVDAISYRVDGKAVVGAQQPAIANPVGGSTVDAESRAAIGALLSALRGHGLIATG